MQIGQTMRAEENDAVAIGTFGIGKFPGAALVEANDGLEPLRAVEIGPLSAKRKCASMIRPPIVSMLSMPL